MDIRINVEFFEHPKTVKLERRLGFAGVKALLSLWMWAAKNHPDGNLSGMTDEDIEIAAKWSPADGGAGDSAFVGALMELRFLDGEKGSYTLHEWAFHNSWVADAPNRSDQNRFIRMASAYPELYAELLAKGVTAISKEDYVKAVAEYNVRRHVVKVPSTPYPERIPEPLLKENPDPVPVPDPDPVRDQGPRPQDAHMSTESGAKEQKPRLEVFLDCYRAFPGYIPQEPEFERAWGVKMLEYCEDFDIVTAFLDARDWVARKGSFRVRDSRAFLAKWLKRLREERTKKAPSSGKMEYKSRREGG